MEESEFPAEVTSLFNNIERNGNPWEISNDKRAEWAADLEIPLLAENPEADVLYWVGCMGSFDRRNQQVATSVAKVLQGGKRQLCYSGTRRDRAQVIRHAVSAMSICGRCRRNRILRRSMAMALIRNQQQKSRAQMAQRGNSHTGSASKHRTIITACPHCFNTIKNEYPQLGGDYEVVHHTVFIDTLLSDEKLKLPAGL